MLGQDLLPEDVDAGTSSVIADIKMHLLILANKNGQLKQELVFFINQLMNRNPDKFLIKFQIDEIMNSVINLRFLLGPLNLN